MSVYEEFARIIAGNQERIKGSPPYKSADYSSMPGANPPHIWRLDTHLPTCVNCGVDSLTAQLNNPATRGEGPCPQTIK